MLFRSKIKKINHNLQKVDKGNKKDKMQSLISFEFGRDFRENLLKICSSSDLPPAFCLRYEKEWTPSKLAAFGTYSNLQDEIELFYKNNFKDIREFYIFLKNKYLNGVEADELIKTMRKET